MIKRDDLVEFVESTLGNDLLSLARQKDIYANGVQFHGASEVSKLALGVSANFDYLQAVVNHGAQFSITHHGIDLTNHNIIASRLHPGSEQLLKYAFANNLTVAGYHYSLDSHSEIGNNATIIRELGAVRTDASYSDGFGWVGEFEQAISREELANRLSKLTSHDVFTVYGGAKMVKRIGVSSGGDKPYDRQLWEIIDGKIDAHISGEIIEPSVGLAKGIGFNYYSCGHYATEVFGVKELGKKISAHFGEKLEVEFIDIPNIL